MAEKFPKKTEEKIQPIAFVPEGKAVFVTPMEEIEKIIAEKLKNKE